MTTNSVLYRIITEDLSVGLLNDRSSSLDTAALALRTYGFLNFTAIKATGSWRGVRENSLVIEVVGTERDADNIRLAARALRISLAQAAVMIQALPCVSILV